MESVSIQLIDLPNELLMIIFKKLNNVELLYSLMGIDNQLDQILYDSMFTNCLTLTRGSSHGDICPLINEMLDRFCSEILPKIHQKIECLTVESVSMESILLANDYPNLRKLCLVSIEEERLPHVFNGENSLFNKFRNQISTLYLSVRMNPTISSDDMTRIMFRNIFLIFPYLIDFQIRQLSPMDLEYLSFSYEIPIFSCSNLLELHISVFTSVDFFCFLDGRLNQLRRIDATVRNIFLPSADVDMKKKLENLRYFSLISKGETSSYRRSVLPLLHRMINLERLDLNLVINDRQFIDGNDLNNNIINFLPKLNHFTFNIHSRIFSYNQNHIRLIEDIQITFKTFPNDKIIYCVDYFPENEFGQCHVYSYPYIMNYYHHISNCFPGGLFKYVRQITLFDERPFEHQFFLKISQSFPFLEQLTLENFQAQNEESNVDNEHLPMIEYPSLKTLYLIDVHDHYIEQFLFHSKTLLLNSISLYVQYHPLQRVTNDFTRNQTRINSTKIKHCSLVRQYHLPEKFYEYFPNIIQ